MKLMALKHCKEVMKVSPLGQKDVELSKQLHR